MLLLFCACLPTCFYVILSYNILFLHLNIIYYFAFKYVGDYYLFVYISNMQKYKNMFAYFIFVC